MQFKAQVQEAILILEEILNSKQPADRTIGYHFKNNRFIGSKDKAVISQLVYDVLRNKANIEFFLKSFQLQISPRKYLIALLAINKQTKLAEMLKIFDGDKYAPKNLKKNEVKFIEDFDKLDISQMQEHERLNYPEWLHESLTKAFPNDLTEQMVEMNCQAETVIRTNILKTTREKLQQALKKEDIITEPTAFSDWGLKVIGKANLFNSKAFKNGWFEVQDEGSQILALLANAQPKQKVLDMCCGAGGKLLAMASTMENKGSIIGTDVNEKRLLESKKRIKRAGIDNAMLKVINNENDNYLKRNKGKFDIVFIDAPCSGTGTWRRNPDSKWNLTKDWVEKICQTQENILLSAKKLINNNGRLIYATCSILKEENHEQIEKFLNNNTDFELVDISSLAPNLTNEKVLQLTPNNHNCDGFFAAILKKKEI